MNLRLMRKSITILAWSLPATYGIRMLQDTCTRLGSACAGIPGSFRHRNGALPDRLDPPQKENRKSICLNVNPWALKMLFFEAN